MIRILQIGPGDFGKTGLSKMVWNWYINIDSKKINMDFLSHFSPEQQYVDYITEHGGKYIYCGSQNSIVRTYRKFILSRKTAKEGKYDIIHIHSSHPCGAFFHLIAVKKHCHNIIIHSHNSNLNTTHWLMHIVNNICRCFLKNEKIVQLACSDLAAKWMFPKSKLKADKYIIIKNGIYISKFSYNIELRKRIRNQLHIENKFVIGHIGAFIYPKNHSFLIETFKVVHSKNHNSVLLLVGAGDLEQEIKEKVSNLGLENAVIFYGTTNLVNELYQAMDCFVLPSRFEGLPIVGIEAQAAGLKTLCADAITQELQITHLIEYMSLCEPIEKWADKILSFDNGYERKDMSNKLKEAGYDITYSAKKLEKLYINLANRGGKLT